MAVTKTVPVILNDDKDKALGSAVVDKDGNLVITVKKAEVTKYIESHVPVGDVEIYNLGFGYKMPQAI